MDGYCLEIDKVVVVVIEMSVMVCEVVSNIYLIV